MRWPGPRRRPKVIVVKGSGYIALCLATNRFWRALAVRSSAYGRTHPKENAA